MNSLRCLEFKQTLKMKLILALIILVRAKTNKTCVFMDFNPFNGSVVVLKYHNYDLPPGLPKLFVLVMLKLTHL
jgi:hypothetical protein